MNRSFFRLVARARLNHLTVALAGLALLGVSAALRAEVDVPSAATAPGATGAPFSTYQRWRDDPVSDWSEANGRVGEMGGWMTYLREAQQPDDAGAPAGSDHQTHH